MKTAVKESVRHILTHCGSLERDEELVILCDPSTVQIASAFHGVASVITESARLLELPPGTRHGEEPPENARRAMLAADLVLSLCRFSLAHSRARIEAGRRRARFLSLPLYSWDLLEDPALRHDFRSGAGVVRRVADALTGASEIRVRTRAGTDIALDARGRVGNYCPGFVEHPGDLGSPPDAEANISPVEQGSEGIAVIDGSITTPEIGLLECPVRLTVEAGQVREFESQNRRYVEVLERMLEDHGSGRRTLAECGVGLNPKARLTGTMLTDEGALGCMHFGLGANHTVGGRNEVDFHLDFVFNEASLLVDGREILRDGALVE